MDLEHFLIERKVDSKERYMFYCKLVYAEYFYPYNLYFYPQFFSLFLLNFKWLNINS